MKIIRYQDKAGNIGYASQQANGSASKLDGTLYGGLHTTSVKAEVSRLLAPVEPTSIICIGLIIESTPRRQARSFRNFR